MHTLVWFEILSDLFVNLAAGWFGLVLIETQLSPVTDISSVFFLTFKTLLGILSLILAKRLKEESKHI